MEQTFRCTECGQEFPSQASLNDHMQKEHSTIRTDRPQDENPVADEEYPASETEEDVPQPVTPER